MAEGTFASLDGEAITATEVIVRAHLQACVYLEAELKARIEAAVTADEVSTMI
jgi:predicted anti-sigma-YlaC factor YlaD